MAALILISGLQGTGKSTLARCLVDQLPAVATMLPEDHLKSGRNVVIESVMSQDWFDACARQGRAAGARVFHVECVCSDHSTHRQRVERRFSQGDSVISWQRVKETAATYAPPSSPAYVADAVLPVQSHVAGILAALDDRHRTRGS